MTIFSEISIGLFIALFIIIFVYIVYIIWENRTSELQYIVNETQIEKSKFEKLINSSTDGALRGLLVGSLFHGLSGGITTAIVFCVVNPVMLIFNEISEKKIKNIKK